MSRHSAGSRMDLASDVAEIWKRTVDSVAIDARAAAPALCDRYSRLYLYRWD